jgi:hypothetical protein
VAGAAAGAATLAALDLTAWRDGPGSLLTWLSAALLGAAGALALDQPARAVTDAAPYSSARRLAARLLVAAGAVLCWAGYSGLVVRGEPAGASRSWTALAVAGTGLVLLGPALAVLLGGPDNREPGSLAGSLVVAVVVGLLVVRLPGGAAPFDVSAAGGDATVIWGGVALLSAVVLARAGRVLP